MASGGMAKAPELTANRLLAALPQEDYARLAPHLEVVDLAFKELIYRPDEPIRFVYFPLDSVVSLLATMADGAVVEVASVGREGMVGLPAFLGARSLAGQSFAQIPGRAARLGADALQEAVAGGGPLRDLLQAYTQALFDLVAQSAACNRLHPLDERLARWLLMTHDRLGADRFPLTQEFMGQMLGVRRASVSTAAAILQRAGLIRYARGRITVTDRAGLEAASCECYGVIRREFDRLFGDGGG